MRWEGEQGWDEALDLKKGHLWVGDPQVYLQADAAAGHHDFGYNLWVPSKSQIWPCWCGFMWDHHIVHHNDILQQRLVTELQHVLKSCAAM